MTLKTILVYLAALSLTVPAVCLAGDNMVGAKTIGSRFVAVRLITKSCAGQGTAGQEAAIASSRSAWDARNLEYVMAMRVYVGFAAGSLEKANKGDGALALLVMGERMTEGAAPLVQAALPSISPVSCQAAIQQIDAGDLDVSRATTVADADYVKKVWGPLLVPGARITFDILTLDEVR